MVTAESLCCGTPIVGFKAGAPEQIALPEFSTFVEFGKIDALKEKLLEFLSNPKDSQLISQEADCYSKKVMAENYVELYYNLMGDSRC